jgi:hypothetical protein
MIRSMKLLVGEIERKGAREEGAYDCEDDDLDGSCE